MNNYSHGDFFDDSDDDERQPARAAQETPMSAHDRALPKKPLSEVLGMTVEKYNKDPPCMPVVVADTRRLAKQPRRPATESGPLPSTEGDEAARTLSFANDPAGGDTPRTSPLLPPPPFPLLRLRQRLRPPPRPRQLTTTLVGSMRSPQAPMPASPPTCGRRPPRAAT